MPIYLIFMMLISSFTHAADAHNNWDDLIEKLLSIDAPLHAKEKIREGLLAWHPEQMSSLMQASLWLKDSYLYNDNIKSLVRGYFLPSSMAYYYKFFIGENRDIPIEGLVHASEIGFIAWRYARALFEAQDNLLSMKGHGSSGLAVLSHYCALSSDYVGNIPTSLLSGDPVEFLSVKAVAHALKFTSALCAGASICLSLEGEFLDVALRALKREYERAHEADALALIIKIMALRKLEAE